MKIRNNNIVNGKGITIWVFLLWVSSFYHSCMDEELVSPSDGEAGSGIEAVLLININMPETSIPASFTRTQTANEYEVSEVEVLVFNYTGDAYVFDYNVKGEDLAKGDEAKTQFKALLVSTEEPLKLYVLANVAESLQETHLLVGMTEAQVRELIVAGFTREGMEDNLPMFGEYDFPDGLSSTVQQTVTVDVLRAVARVDVLLDLEGGSGEFALEEVYAFRVNNLIQVIPDESATTGDLKVHAPSVPSGAALLDNYVFNRNPVVDDSIGQLYLPESTGIENDSEKLLGKTTIVIGGRFRGSSTTTYYRVDFDSGVAGHPFGQILRNHRYAFIIKSVLSEGWSTPEDAANNLATSMVVQPVIWEDFSSEIVLTGNERFGISGREISLRYVKNREKSLHVESTLDYTIQWIKNRVPVGASTSERDVEITNDDFSVRIVHDNADHPDVTRLVFRTLKHNNLGAIKTDTLRISVGNVWVMDITVKQDNAAMYADRNINVLSVGPSILYAFSGVGNFGVTAAARDASGLSMRMIIEVQFAAGGSVPVGGSFFTRVVNDDSAIDASTGSALTAMQQIINAQDVIFLTYNVRISTAVSNHIVSWLRASPRRVLIVSTDTNLSNDVIRNNAYVTTTPALWAYSTAVITDAAVTHYHRAAVRPGSSDFFDGPFGLLTDTVTFKRYDEYAGYTSVIPDNVTPLIVGSTQGYENFMFFGVNRDKRIIYHGDANLFQNTTMGNTNGTVVNSLDKLMANVWAWVVEQVIYGDG